MSAMTDAVLEDGEEIAALVGSNLRRLRTRNGLSLDRLAKSSGVSRAMLGQIELGRSAPTITVLWKIARALGVPVSTFTAVSCREAVILRANAAKWINAADGGVLLRALFPHEGPRREEFYELRLGPHTTEQSPPHAPGTRENLVVAQGVVDLVVDGDWHRLETGDAIHFLADRPHAYRNSEGGEAVAYLVVCNSQ